VSRSRAARDHLAVALDVPGLAEAEALIPRLGGVPGWLKVGLELFVAAGPEAVRRAAKHARVFLDLKLHDIPNTAAGAAAAATRLGAAMLTVHAGGGVEMMRAAREAAGEAAAKSGAAAPRLVAVSVLTSFGPEELRRVGVAGGVPDHVARLVDLAREAGLDGAVASAREAHTLRRRVGPDFWLVTPGIRPAGASLDDQSRVATPAAAIEAGADLLVIGRPIARAADPAAAARAALEEIEVALAARGA